MFSGLEAESSMHTSLSGPADFADDSLDAMLTCGMEIGTNSPGDASVDNCGLEMAALAETTGLLCMSKSKSIGMFEEGAELAGAIISSATSPVECN